MSCEKEDFLNFSELRVPVHFPDAVQLRSSVFWEAQIVPTGFVLVTR